MNLATANPAQRQISIDAFRAITLILMIFVNDHGSLIGIPGWLGHTAANEDGMGFADVIFPAFLFIVGLSIPFAVQSRLKKGSSLYHIELHIIYRSVALLIMGFFHVNMGGYSSQALLPKLLWETLITIGFFMVWFDYPKESKHNYSNLFKWTGIALLIALFFLYKGDAERGSVWMQPKWWGILGLIGWTYLITSSVYLLSRGKLSVMVAAFLFFVFFNAAKQLGWLSPIEGIGNYLWIVGDGAMPALATAGVITGLLYRNPAVSYRKFWMFTLLASAILIGFGFATRHLWGISKIRATPSWATICMGISLLCFSIMIYLTEIKGYKKWYGYIRSAGNSTLTCYLLPYLYYVILQIIPFHFPVFFRTGVIGLAKSMLLALFIVFLGNLMEKRGIRLKL